MAQATHKGLVNLAPIVRAFGQSEGLEGVGTKGKIALSVRQAFVEANPTEARAAGVLMGLDLGKGPLSRANKDAIAESICG